MTSSAARAAAAASGPPPKVEECSSGWPAYARSQTQRRAIATPIGITPPERPFASVTTSGTTPSRSQAKRVAAAAEARLHLVDDQQRARGIAGRARRRQISLRWQIHATLALHGFDDEGRRIPAAQRDAEGGRIAVRHVRDVRERSCERGAVGGRTARRERAEGLTVVAAGRRDDARPAGRGDRELENAASIASLPLLAKNDTSQSPGAIRASRRARRPTTGSNIVFGESATSRSCASTAATTRGCA